VLQYRHLAVFITVIVTFLIFHPEFCHFFAHCILSFHLCDVPSPYAQLRKDLENLLFEKPSCRCEDNIKVSATLLARRYGFWLGKDKLRFVNRMFISKNYLRRTVSKCH